MTTVMRIARSGSVPDVVRKVAEIEGISPEKLRDRVARGVVIVPRNVERRGEVKIVGVGEGLSTKVNVNVGTSTLVVNLDMEVEKAKVAVKYGTDTIMDLSTGGDLDTIRRTLMRVAPVPFGTVPIYQAFIEAAKRHGAGVHMTEDDILNTIEKHLKDGVDFMTLHAGITRDLVLKMKKVGRVAGIVSRGGAILAAWMLHNDEENPLYKNWDYILELFAKYDAVISIGDALRPGAIVDAHDYFQIAELLNVAELVKRAWEKGVQVMVEGPGHVPLDKIEADVKLQKSLCHGAPYYVLGPLPTDIAAGYDHIASAVGAAIAAAAGADLICYVTPAEHLSLPTPEQVREGLIAAKIGAHIGDIVKLGERARKWDLEMAIARAKLDWERIIKLSIDPEKASEIRRQHGEEAAGPCSMCGELCVYLILSKYLGGGSLP